MTEKEICRRYRNAKNQSAQLQILAELNSVSRTEIIRILVKNGEKLPAREISRLYKRLDVLNEQIAEKEREYREIIQALNMGEIEQNAHNSKQGNVDNII